MPGNNCLPRHQSPDTALSSGTALNLNGCYNKGEFTGRQRVKIGHIFQNKFSGAIHHVMNLEGRTVSTITTQSINTYTLHVPFFNQKTAASFE